MNLSNECQESDHWSCIVAGQGTTCGCFCHPDTIATVDTSDDGGRCQGCGGDGCWMCD